MCFSNLPLEFDEAGNPYLAEEAEPVEHPDEHAHDGDHVMDCGCDSTAAELAADPEGAYEAIVDSLPEGVREQVVSEDGGTAGPQQPDPESVGGD